MYLANDIFVRFSFLLPIVPPQENRIGLIHSRGSKSCILMLLQHHSCNLNGSLSSDIVLRYIHIYIWYYMNIKMSIRLICTIRLHLMQISYLLNSKVKSQPNDIEWLWHLRSYWLFVCYILYKYQPCPNNYPGYIHTATFAIFRCL